ncbi:MAG: undecaprenyl-diphosphatase UppP [Candidatus Dojkabacteria bacterium]
MTIIQAIILGITQGITEFLPISSSAHLVLVPELLGWQQHSLAFDIMLHMATLLAILIYFRRSLTELGNGIFSPDRTSRQRSKHLLYLISLTTIPTILFYFLTKPIINEDFKSLSTISISLILVGILLVATDHFFKDNPKKVQDLKPRNAIFIGIFQALALIRGISRSGISIVGGSINGLTKKEAIQYAFIAGIPAIGGGLALLLLDLPGGRIEEATLPLLVGFISSFLSGYLTVFWLMRFITRSSLAVFGYYRVVVGVFILLAFVL